MCFDAKTLGWIQIVGSVLSGILAYQNEGWEVLILAVLFLITGIHHVMEKKKR
jgi:hypothetical protein